MEIWEAHHWLIGLSKIWVLQRKGVLAVLGFLFWAMVLSLLDGGPCISDLLISKVFMAALGDTTLFAIEQQYRQLNVLIFTCCPNS